MRITVLRWSDFQHYKNRRPPWIKLHRQLLENRHWFALSGDASKLLAECWLIASETDEGTIHDEPEDLAFRLHRDPANIADCLQELETHEFIAMDEEYASKVLARCLPRGEERESRVEESSVSFQETGASPDVENPWGDFAGWFRTEGFKLLWMADHPPSWAKGEWTLNRDLSICKELAKVNSLEMIRSVIEATTEPSTMAIFWKNGQRQRWSVEVGKVHKRKPTGHIGQVLNDLQGRHRA